MVGEVNQFVCGGVAYFRHAACKTHLRELDQWLRHKLRCVRLKQGKRRYAIANLLIGQGVPAQRAWLLALSGKGWWRLSQSPQAQEAFSTRWFEVLGLVSLEHQYAALQLAERNRRIRGVRPVVWEGRGRETPPYPDCVQLSVICGHWIRKTICN